MAAAHSPGPGTDAHAEHEKPEDWGWHADFGGLARAGGIISFIALALMLTATHYNHAGTAALIFFMAVIVVGLLWDRRARRTAWRR